VFTSLREFFELVGQDAKAVGRKRLSVAFFLTALLGLNKFSAVLLYRVGSALFHKGFPYSALAKLAGRWNCLCNSCEFSPHAKIGPGLHIPHPIGIVVGAATAGKNLTLLQNASIALKDRSLSAEDHHNYPVFGDNVTVGPSAAVLGRLFIGDGALIGANAVVLSDVPPECRVVGNPARILPARSKPGGESKAGLSSNEGTGGA
jgi:serine O-acetyltransferase